MTTDQEVGSSNLPGRAKNLMKIKDLVRRWKGADTAPFSMSAQCRQNEPFKMPTQAADMAARKSPPRRFGRAQFRLRWSVVLQQLHDPRQRSEDGDKGNGLDHDLHGQSSSCLN